MKRFIYTLACLVLSVGAWAQTTLQEQINAAGDGATITLTENVSVTSQIEISGKSVILDLNGKTVEYTGTTVLASGVFLVHNGAGLTVNASGGGSVISGNKAYAAIAVTKKGDNDANPAKLTINGGNFEGYYYAIVGNGARHNTEITINDGTFKGLANNPSTDDMGLAIYHPQEGKLTINGGEFEGPAAGVEIRAGELNITGGTFKATATEFSEKWNGSGSTVVGAALAISQHSTNKDIKVNITGGTFDGLKAVYEVDLNTATGDKSDNIDINIEGGTFKGDVASENVKNFVSGGTFSSPVSEDYCANDFKPTDDGNGHYGVIEKNYVAQIGDKKYESLAEAISAAQNGEEVTLLADVTDNITIPAGKNIILDLNGKTLSGGSVASNGNKAAIVNNGTITIQDSSAEQTGTIKREDDDTGLSASKSYYVIDNQGTMTIKSGTITNNAGLTTSHKGSSLIRNGEVAEGAVLNIEGGTLTQDNFDVIKNGGNNSVLNITGGTIKSANSYAVLSYDEVNMSAGTVTGKVCLRSYDSDHAEANITGGTINGDITVETYPGNTPTTLSKCNISGGAVINGTLSVGEGNGNTFTANDEKGTIAVSGGTFNNAVPEEYCAEGLIPTKNSDGTYGVKEGTFVARIDEQGYETIADAITAATEGQTIVLLADISKNVTIPADKTLTIDLNGKTISYSTSAGAITNKGNLTIDDSATGGKVFNTKSYPAIKNDGAAAVLTIKSGTIESPTTSTTNGTIMNQSGTVNVTGGEIIGAKYPIYTGSSAAVGKTAVLNVSGGKISSQTSYAIYLAGGKGNITGGNLNSADGLDDVYLYYGALKAPESVSNNASATFTSAEDGYVYSLAGAVNGATDDETVTMVKDVNLVAAVTFNKNLTLNLNGHNIKSPVSALKVTGKALTIEGEGTVKGANPNVIATGSDPYAAVWANGGNVIINGGTFDEGGVDGSGNSTIFINKAGTITINGGEFKNSASFGGKYWIFNIQDAVKETASIVAKGGKYHNFDPANNVNDGNPENMGTNYVADGYISVKIATSPYDIYEVKEGQWVATIADEAVKKFRYTSLDEAIDDANAAGKDITITLLSNAETEKETLPANVTINASGKVLTMPSFVVLDGQAFTLPTITGAETYKVHTATYIRTNISTTEWGTVCLPFSLTSGNGADYYTYNNITGNTLTVDEVENTETIVPNTPVVFKKAKGGDLEINQTDAIVSLKAYEASLATSSLVGTYTSTSIDADGNIYFINSDTFHKAQVSLTVPAYRAYINYTAPGEAAPRTLYIVVSGDDVTAIGTLTTDDAAVSAIYDATGRKLSAPQKGINIMKLENGKTVKVMIK